MAERDEIIAVVDLHGCSSWRFDYAEIERVFDRSGVEAGIVELQSQFNKGLAEAVISYARMKRTSRGG